MTAGQDKAVVRRFVSGWLVSQSARRLQEGGLSAGQLISWEATVRCSRFFTNHSSKTLLPGALHGAAGRVRAKRKEADQLIGMYRSAFPDIHFHTGEMMGVEPTGKRVEVSGVEINHVEA